MSKVGAPGSRKAKLPESRKINIAIFLQHLHIFIRELIFPARVSIRYCKGKKHDLFYHYYFVCMIAIHVSRPPFRTQRNHEIFSVFFPNKFVSAQALISITGQQWPVLSASLAVGFQTTAGQWTVLCVRCINMFRYTFTNPNVSIPLLIYLCIFTFAYI